MREYSILQDKIDKIGAFRFTIKGWALTLNTGAVVAAFATSRSPTIGILLVSVLVIGLFSLEWRQANLTEIFQSRALRIETKITRRLSSLGLHRLEFASLIRSPGIASELRTPIERHMPSKSASSSLARRGKFLRRFMSLKPVLKFRRSTLRRKLVGSDFHFYFLLWIAAVLFVWFQQGKIAQKPAHRSEGHALRICVIPNNRDRNLRGGAIWREGEE
jgi:hypothetical protein